MPWEVVCRKCAYILPVEKGSKEEAFNEIMFQHFIFSHGYEPCERDIAIYKISKEYYLKLRAYELTGLIYFLKEKTK